MSVKVREKVKGSGIWWVFIHHQGKRRSKQIGSKRLASEVGKKIEAKLVLGDMDLDDGQNKIPVFSEYAEKWIEIHVPATCKASTSKDYRAILKNHVLPVFGKLPITEIKRLMVKNFLMQKLQTGRSPSTVNHIKNVVAGVLNLSLDDEIISVNPAHRLGKIFHQKQYKEDSDSPMVMDPLTKEELTLLLNTFQEHLPSNHPLARTGMRLGEGLALKWSDIDFSGRFITVRRGIVRGRIESPKNGKVRRVDMSQQLTDTLLRLKVKHQRSQTHFKSQSKEATVLSIEHMEINTDWVFPSAAGTPLHGGNWRKRIFNEALKIAGLRKIRVHDLRHTYASLLIQAGESLAYIRDQLGHHSISVTVDIYGHLVPGANKQAVDRLDDLPERKIEAKRS